ncbi:hypothetical protein G7Y89_g13139 [Cudoniella acicularis]|uniref:Uncharacterized protein n=1 Tax=Cudoniella acicularis TaxID=354080 RepID=A0A8H4RA45_9HELO|nr:hypothetical protein G7Y89_g13139 [Cudoniella acicularis]
MPLNRQTLWNVKEIALQANYFPSTALPYYRNNDGSPHWSNWTDNNGVLHYTYHVTIDWRWDNNQKTCHVNIDPQTGAHTDTTWF